MEEDVGVSVKVTRLRRRLSVEQSDDVSSPSTPSKKRGGRLAAKPQLELINENAQISSPRKTRRQSIANVEAEEKPLTPSRRSTRVKSNTSIVSEILSSQITDSPRAKRALRRNSAAGSDNEGPVTPARPTRRTRKDSASSVENQEPAPVTRPLQVVEMVIDEEPENEEQKTARKSKSTPNKSIDKLSPDSARKSRRLLEKRNRRSGSLISDHDSSLSAVENKSLNASMKNEISDTETKSHNRSRKSIESKDSEISETETKSHNKSRKSLESKDSEISGTETKSHNKSRKSLESKDGEISETETKSHNKSKKSLESKDGEISETETKSHNKSRKSSESKQSEKVSGTETKSHNKSRKSIESTESEIISEIETKPNKKSKKSIESDESGTLSKSNMNLLKVIDSESNMKTSKHNKSTSTLHTKQNENKKRNRTESWPILLAASPSRDNIVFSDNEQSKKKKRQSVNKSLMNNSNINNTSTKEVSNDTAQNDKEHSVTLLDTHTTKRKKRQSETSLADMATEAVEATENPAPNLSNNEDTNAIHQSNGNTERQPANSGMSSEMAMLFQSPPGNIQAIVYFEDSDSNSVITETTKKMEELDNEDQCVPEVNHGLEFQEKMSPGPTPNSNCEENIFQPRPKNSNDEVDSCEPMDIDDTIHEEILQKSHEMLQESATERKSLSLHQSGTMEERNKSKRKSSLNSRDTPDRSGLIVSGNENKSTLILSQIKDVSATSDNAQQSPKTATAELLSNSNNSDINSSNKLSKTNLSSNDLKGTPLKQKSVLKLAMQTSTPINTPQAENKSKVEEKNASINKNDSNISNSIDETVSDEDSDEESGQKSKLLDDEAEEASDDYESGDSRDEEERQYEEENEIVECGETLGSDDEASNDTDYEKDSFIVSSDAEDDELLSGSGDDLSMSDNELSMSKKSKKKYNERKLKEQKAASREMYESRHKLNTSDPKSPAPKTKSKRMRIDSSLIDSDEEVVVTSKKKNRLRLDSTLDTSTKLGDNNESLNKSQKSNKSLQDSICNQSVNNEKEITVCDEDISLTDPLQVQFKQEPKTPQKDLNMSVVQFTDRQEIENVEVVASNTLLNQTETDPLQATMAGEDYDSSESEEILQSYDLMLKNLNANKKPKLNTDNISLNVAKKSKKDKNATIIDQLNLTNTKKPNKKNVKSEDVVDSIKETPKVIQASDNEDSSNSIDLQLLFSEDNCGSGDENASNKDEPNNVEEEMFVPLKKSTGKTNINESLGHTSRQNSSLNESNKKKKNRKSSLVSEDTAEPENTNKATHDDKVFNESIKKKNRKSSLVPTEIEELQDANKSQDETTLNESKKKRNRKSSMASAEAIDEPLDVEEPVLNESIKKTKKRKSSLVDDAQPDSDLFFIDTDGAFSSVTEKKSCLDKAPLEVLYVSEKKKNKKLDLSQNIEANDNVIEESSAKSTSNTQNKKKKNKKHNLETSVVAEGDSDDAPEEVAYRSEKALNQETELITETVAGPAETGSGKKKKKKKKKTSIVSEPPVETTNVSEELSSSKKRKRKPSDTGAQSSAQDVEEVVTGALNESSAGSKKKRKISRNSETNEQSNAEVDDSGDHEKKTKKKKHKKNPELNFENTVPEPEISPTQIKKNKKRKERDEDNDSKKTKVPKEDSFHEVHNIPPASTISRHEEKSKKTKVISTSNFIVENARQKRAKPSHYLEESIYLNDDSPFGKKEKPRMKKPKVLPFMPTASISESGYTTNFKINQLSQNVQFVAEPAGISFSKESYLQRKEIKRLGTYDRYKKQINKKLSKF